MNAEKKTTSKTRAAVAPISEARRSAIRLISTYSRMLVGIVLGLWGVRLLVGSVGPDAFGLIVLLGQATGFGAIVNDVVRYCLVRELGAAYHDDRPERFAAVYRAAVAISAVVAGLTCLLFLGLLLLIPVFSIPPDLVSAARWFLVAMMAMSVVQTLLAAPINLLLVSERMTAYNRWMLSTRIAAFSAALIVVATHTRIGISGAVITYGVVSACLNILFTVATAAEAIAREPGASWKVSRPDPRDVRAVLASSGWNAGTVIAATLQLRAHAIIMNLGFGLLGNFVFGIAAQMTGYVRTVASGSVLGIDAVTARVQADGREDGVRHVALQSIRVTAFVTVPACVLLFALADALVEIWVGNTPRATPESLALAGQIIRVLTLGVLAWGIGDAWTRVLYGAGHVRRYAPLLIVSGLANPLVATFVLLFWNGPGRALIPAATFTLINVATYFVGMPVIAKKVLGGGYLASWRAIGNPALAALIALAGIFWVRELDQWTLPLLAATTTVYGVVYLLAAWFLVLNSNERGLARQAAGEFRRRLDQRA